MRGSCLGCIGIHAAVNGITRCTANAYNAVIKVDVFPFQTEHFSAPETAVYRKIEERAVLYMLIVQQFKKTRRFFGGIYLLVFMLHFRERYLLTGIIRNNAHLHGISEHIRNKIEYVTR